jgi:hypothetical protein
VLEYLPTSHELFSSPILKILPSYLRGSAFLKIHFYPTFLILKKHRRRLMISPCCLCVCVSPSNFFVFCVVRVVSKESRRLVLPRSACNILPSSISLCLLFTFCLHGMTKYSDWFVSFQ